MRVYATAADHISYHTYKVLSPETAQLLPDEILSGLIAPIHDPIYPQRMTFSRKTIIQLMDLHFGNVPFTIVNDEDVVSIGTHINLYLDEIRNHPHTDELRIFLNKLMPLRVVIERLQRRVFKLHPDWAAKYHTLDSGFINLLYAFLEGTGHSIDRTVAIPEALKKATGQDAPPMLAMPSMQDKLRAAKEAQRISEDYAANPGSIYNSGLV